MKKLLCFLPLIPAGFGVAALIYRSSFNAENLLLVEGVAFSCGIICVLAYLISPENNQALWFLTAAFIFSIMGDLFLKKRTTNFVFIMGIFFFLLAHIGYSIFCLTKIKFSWLFFAVVVTPYLILYFTMFLPSDRARNNGILAFIVFLYIVMSCLTFSASIDSKSCSISSWVFTVGIASLLVSDTLIAARDFMQYRKFAFLIMPLYYLCHILLALSVTLKQINQE